ncbi:FMN-dependent NADH-azoreductase [Erysipelotrichaceae bacterium]|nr:FMN-dependent NADH-azoreductase [Erysipelotrichaceae bacterium]
MTKVLVLLGSPAPASNSAAAANYFIEAYSKNNPEAEIEIVRVVDNQVGTFTTTILSGKPTAEDMEVLGQRTAILEKYMAADKVILATPMWNFSLPGFFKEYIDCFFVAGKTFKYLAEPNERGNLNEGLLATKAIMHIQAMGGSHVGSPRDIGHAQIRQMFEFLDLVDMVYVPIEGTNIPGASTLDIAKEKLSELAKTF